MDFPRVVEIVAAFLERQGQPVAVVHLARGLPTTPEDVAALRRLKAAGVLDTAAYLRALATLPQPSPDALRTRGGPRGEPFVPDDPRRES